MALVKTQLKLSKLVTKATEDAITFIPETGLFYVSEFIADAAFDSHCAVKLVWDYGQAGETLLWSIKGSHSVNLDLELTGDGSKKLAVCLDNGLDDSVVLSGYALVVQEV